MCAHSARIDSEEKHFICVSNDFILKKKFISFLFVFNFPSGFLSFVLVIFSIFQFECEWIMLSVFHFIRKYEKFGEESRMKNEFCFKFIRKHSCDALIYHFIESFYNLHAKKKRWRKKNVGFCLQLTSFRRCLFFMTVKWFLFFVSFLSLCKER